MFCRLLLCLLLWPGSSLGAWTPEKWFDRALSPRLANYRIRATLDWPRKMLKGEETIAWSNDGTAATQELPLHLYLNAFKGPQSIFAREGGLETSPAGLADAHAWGYTVVRDVQVEGRTLQGHYGEDETVYWLQLPRPVVPGETIHLEIKWETRFPRVVNRSGWSGSSPGKSSFLMGAQWYPKVGVYQANQWNCQAYHANTEFFADFGVYDVELSLPNALLLAHTGTQTNFRTPADIPKDPGIPGNVIWKLHAEDVHDFAWAASPVGAWDFEVHEYRGVQVFYYSRRGSRSGSERQRMAVQAALRNSAELLFRYPYPVLSVLDVPPEAEGADGMEYPTLFTAGRGRFEPLGLRDGFSLPFWPHWLEGGPEGITIHEFSHQYFQGMLASNEVEEPWLDEGFASWFTRKTLDRTYLALFASRRFQVGSDLPSLLDYWGAPSLDPMNQVGFQMYNYGSYARNAYAKPLLVLDQLEATLGRPVMEQVLKAYAQEMAFRHPTQADFRRIAERVSGRNLGEFWRDFVEGTEALDIVIHQVDARDVTQGGWMATAGGHVFVKPQPASPGRRGTITLFRRGGIVRPIILWVRLENRREHRMTWDGKDRWVTYEFDSPIEAALLDPDGQYPILKDRLHAAYTSRPTRRGFHYWSQMLWGALTTLLQGAGLG